MDGYGRLYSAMRSAAKEGTHSEPVWVRLGKVLSTAPLKVDVGGTTQEAGRFYISRRLLNGYQESVTIQGEASGSFSVSASCENGSHDKLSISNGTMTLTEASVVQSGPALAAGDLVLLFTDDDQTFYLMDKVVRL